MPASARNGLTQRICAEYLDVPGLRLTVPQAVRFLGLDLATCEHVFRDLEHAGFLRRSFDASHVPDAPHIGAARTWIVAPISVPLRRMARVLHMVLLSGTMVATMATMVAAQTGSTKRSSQQAPLPSETKPPIAPSGSPSRVGVPLAGFRWKSVAPPCDEGPSRDRHDAGAPTHGSGLIFIGGLFPSATVAAQVALIRSRGHLSKGGYDGTHGIKQS